LPPGNQTPNLLSYNPPLFLAQLQRPNDRLSTAQDQQILLTTRLTALSGHVLRLREGDRAMDGQRRWWLAKPVNQAQILEPISVQTELPISITLMVALCQKKMDLIVDALLHWMRSNASASNEQAHLPTIPVSPN